MNLSPFFNQTSCAYFSICIIRCDFEKCKVDNPGNSLKGTNILFQFAPSLLYDIIPDHNHLFQANPSTSLLPSSPQKLQLAHGMDLKVKIITFSLLWFMSLLHSICLPNIRPGCVCYGHKIAGIKSVSH